MKQRKLTCILLRINAYMCLSSCLTHGIWFFFLNWKMLNVRICIFDVSFQAVESADNGYVTEPEGKNGEEGESKINNG